MFGEVVSEIVGTASPVYKELTLFDAIFDPIKTHIHGFGSALFNCIVGDSGRTGIVSLDWCGRLWVPHIVKDGSEHGCFFAIVEEGAKLGLGRGRENDRHDGGMNVDGAVGRGRWCSRRRRCKRIAEWTAEEENAARP